MNKVVKNFIYNGIYKVLFILLPVVLTPYLTRTLGSTKLGIDSYVVSIVTIVQLFGTLGLNMYSGREISKRRDDKYELTKLYYEIQTIRWNLAIIVSLLYVCFAMFHEYRVFFLIQTATLVSYCIDVTWLFNGLEEMKLPVLRNIFIRIAQAVCIFVFIKDENDLIKYVLIIAISNTLSAICMYTQVGKWVGKYDKSVLELKRHIKPVVALFLPQVAVSLYTQFDRTMIGMLADDISYVSIYDKAENIVKLPLNFTSAATTAMLPRIAYEYSKGNIKRVSQYLKTEMKYILLFLIPCVAGMFVVSDAFTVVYLGKDYYGSADVMKILSPMLLLFGLAEVFGSQLLVAINEVKGLTLAYGLGALSNIVFNAILIPVLNAQGAAIGTLIAQLIVVVIQLYYARTYIGKIDIVGNISKKFVAAAAMFIVIWYMGNDDCSLSKMMIQVGVGVLVYVAGLMIVRDDEFIQVRRYIRKKLFRKKDKVDSKER